MEYRVLTQQDRRWTGKFSPENLERTLNSYAAEGWRVVSSIPRLCVTGGRDASSNSARSRWTSLSSSPLRGSGSMPGRAYGSLVGVEFCVRVHCYRYGIGEAIERDHFGIASAARNHRARAFRADR